ncbi:MAG: efflux transporter outer membrane subunit [Betaproteobacteria bacterium]
MTKIARRLAPLAVALWLCGCSLIPTYERPAAPMPTAWPGAASVAAPAPDLAWQDYFSDASLRELITLALANNRDLRVALLNIELARAQLGIRRADQLPTVSAALAGVRSPTGTGKYVSVDSAGLVLTSYELDFFGRVASLKEQALAQYLASQEGSKTVQISLVANVAQTWLALLAHEELVVLSTQTLGTRNESLRLTRLRFEQGASSELELRLAQSLSEAAQVALAQQRRQRALDENALALLLGQALPTQARAHLGTLSLAQLRLAELPAGAPSDLLLNRPDIRQAEAQLIAANANIGAARAAFFPRISLTVGAGSASNSLSGLFKGGSWGFTSAPQLLLPLFDGGRNQAGLDAAKSGRDIAVAQYDKTIQTAFREVADALAGRDTLGEQLRAQAAQADAESARLRLTELRYRNGAAGLLDWLDAQRSQFAIQQALVLTQLAYLQNQVALYKTLGGDASAAQALRAP